MTRFVPLFLLVVALAACGVESAPAGPAPTDPPPSTSAASTTLAPSNGEAVTSTTSTTEAPTSSEFPVTVVTPTGDLTIPVQPQSIVSLSPTATEMLFAIGAGSQVVATDSLSTFPPEAPATDLAAFTPNVEAILEFEPDLVIAAFDPGELASGLEAAGVPVLFQFSAVTLDDVYAQIDQLGEATGKRAEAVVVNDALRARIDAVVASLPDFETPPTYYHELDPTYFSATSSTFIGEVYGLLGLENIADAADPDGEFFGFPQLSEEFIIEADPDFIFLADTKCCDASADTVADRPGWETLSAVAEGNVVELDDDIASRWGPRIVDYLEQVAAAVMASSG